MLFQKSEKVFFRGIFVFNSINCFGSKNYSYFVFKMRIARFTEAKYRPRDILDQPLGRTLNVKQQYVSVGLYFGCTNIG